MEDRRLGEDITEELGSYLNQKEQQYSRELTDVRSRLEERVKEVKTDLEKDLREVKTDLKDDLKEVKQDLAKSIKEVKDDLKGDLKGIRTQVMALMVLGVTSLITLIGIIVTLLVQN